MFSRSTRKITAPALRVVRYYSSQSVPRSLTMGVLGGAAAAITGYEIYKNREALSKFNPILTVHAGTTPAPQPNVYSQTKDHALYLWIHLKSDADYKKVGKIMAGLPKMVDTVSPPNLADESDEVWAGVGFGPDAYCKIAGKKAPKEFDYPNRKGALGEMPATGGDVFVHAKSNSVSKLFELAQTIQRALPADSVQNFKDIYSFVYQNGRDLSGFIDGTENRADDEGRFEVAVDKNTCGSYCITQVWLHDHKTIATQKDSTLEGWVGRTKNDSTELKKKTISSHVTRMTSGSDFGAKKPVEIVRQSMPFGTVAGDSGLFFIGFAEKPHNFEYMLDRMVGRCDDGASDDVMRLSKCVQGNYWYFPSSQEIKKLA